jgi:ABC-2 type transport system ATP-binding protein
VNSEDLVAPDRRQITEPAADTPPGRPQDAGDDPMAIATHGLTKRYGRRTVVDSLDIEVPTGVVAGLVGPNGAGKTTTLRMLLGLVRPSAGDGRVLGASLATPARYLDRVGALIESPAFYPSLSGARNLMVQATLGGLDPASIPALLERVDLADRAGDAYRTYSLGMKQRLAIAGALLGHPALLILDEPTNGLDPAGIRQMRGLVRSLADDGPAILISSHLLSEVQQVCDWLIVIKEGRRVFQGSMAELLASGGEELVLATQRPADLTRLGELLASRGLGWSRDGSRLRVALSQLGDLDQVTGLADQIAEINRTAQAAGLTLVELSMTHASLEDRYETLMGGRR